MFYLWIGICCLFFLFAGFLFSEFTQENQVSKDWTRVDFASKKSFERSVTSKPSRVSVFAIPEFQTELFPFFDPAFLIEICKRRSQYDVGLNVVGMNPKTGRFAFVENFPFLSFYQWCWNQRSQSSSHLHAHHWISYRNARFLADCSSNSSVDFLAVIRAAVDKLLAPLSMVSVTSEYDMILLSHRASNKYLPYFVHFMTRRTITAAFGSVRISFLPWVDARRYVTPEEAVLPLPASSSASDYRSEYAKYEWTLSPRCNLRQLVRFASFTLHHGQTAVIPPNVVYQLEHVLPNSKREKFEQCCVLIQADYMTASNRVKNGLFFQNLNLDLPSGPGAAVDSSTDEDSRGGGRRRTHQRNQHHRHPSSSHIKNEVELQNEAWGAAPNRNASFMKPEMNPPMKEEKEQLEAASAVAAAAASTAEWGTDASIQLKRPEREEYPVNIFSMAISPDEYYQETKQQEEELAAPQLLDQPQGRTVLSASIDLR